MMTTTAQNPAPPVQGNDQLELSILSAWLNVSEVGLCVVDDHPRVVMLNTAASRMLGIDGLKMINKPLLTLLDAIKLGPTVVQWLSTPGFDGEQLVNRHTPAGTVELVLRSSTVRARAEDGTTGLFKMVAITDVTELLSAQRRVNSEAFRKKLQALNAGVVVVDAQKPNLPIIYVNERFETATGYSLAEVMGRNCGFLQGGDKDQPGLVGLRTAIRNQSNGYARLRNYRKDGTMFVIELFISPIKDDHGLVTHFVGVQQFQHDI